MKKVFALVFSVMVIQSVSVFDAKSQINLENNKSTNLLKHSLLGNVVDSLTSKPIEYASVRVIDENKKVVDGTICNKTGNFELNKLEITSFILIIDFLGYESRSINVYIPSEKKQLNIGRIKLVSVSKKLDEVIISGDKEIVENKIDRITYNAERDISNAGVSALDVLRKAPLVSVDLNGKVQLKGNSNIRILIDGKPSTIFAANLSEALNQIQSDQIKAIEIITNPSAKFDAEGTGGIINIILKKNVLPGFNFAINSSLGTRISSGSINASYHKDKLTINTVLGVNAFYTRRSSTLNRSEYDLSSGKGLAYLTQNKFQRNLGSSAYGQITLDYNLSDHDAINASLRGNLFGSNIFNINNNFNLNSFYYSAIVPNSFAYISHRTAKNDNSSNGIDFNIGYTKQLSDADQLTLLALYSSSFNDISYLLGQSSNSAKNYSEIGKNTSPNREYTFQSDYTHSFKKNSLLELGLKVIVRKMSSDYIISYDSISSNQYIINAARSDSYSYNQNVYAAYSSYKLDFAQRYSAQIGFRFEATETKGLFLNNTSSFTKNYFNSIPSISFSREFGKSKTTLLRASYTRRIQRPSIYYLNPFINLQDNRNAVTGNPYLDAEISNSYELSFSAKIKNLSFNTIAYARTTDASIQDVSRLISSSTLYSTGPTNQYSRLTTYQNIAYNASYGLSIATSLKVLPNLSVSANLNPSFVDFESLALSLRKRAFVANANANIRWTFKGYTSQLNYNAFSRDIYIQGSTSGFQTNSISVRKDLPNKHGSWTLSVDNPIKQSVTLYDYQDAVGISSTNISNIYLRGIRVTFSYLIGKRQRSDSKFNKTLNNNDQKEGRNDNQ